MGAPSSVSFFINLNRWCNEIVSAATLVSRSTLISAAAELISAPFWQTKGVLSRPCKAPEEHAHSEDATW